MTDITEFVQRELYPALFAKVPELFPSMEFEPYRGGWSSRHKLNGELSHDRRRDKTVVTRNVPQRAIEQGGESVDLITLYKEQNPHLHSDIDAIKEIAHTLGLSLPEKGDPQQWAARKAKQDKVEALAARMVSDLWTEAGAATLDYLRNVRGFSEDFIKWAEFGHVSSKTAKEMIKTLSYTTEQGEEKSLPTGVGVNFPLAIPLRSGGRIQGFNFRSILPPEELKRRKVAKYRNFFLSENASKKSHFTGLTGLNITGTGERGKYITIVEGEMDALRASFAGIPNVVAAGGTEVYTEALKEAKKKGAEGAIILFDTEGGDTPEEVKEAQKKNHEKVRKAIETIHAHGLSPFVCYLEPDAEGQKQDVDSYLKTHSDEQLKEALSWAKSGARFLFQLISQEAIEKQGGEGEGCSDMNLQEYKRRTLNLCNSSFVSPTDRDAILTEFAASTGDYITKESLQEEADLQKAAADRARQGSEASTLLATAYKMAAEGKTEEALELAAARLPEVRRISKEAEFSKLLELPTAEGIRARRTERPTGVATGYAFEHGDEEEELILPSGALTYVCAPTAHGKSRFLENLALNLATDGSEGSVLYFSYEESQTDVEIELLNIFANIELSANNLRTLGAYYSKGDTSKIKGMTSKVGADRILAKHNLYLFRQKEAEFDGLLTSGKLRVYYRDYDSSSLVEAIRYMAGQIKVKAVFVDYIQLLHKRGTRLQRKDELKEICKDFMTLAVETRLPIVLAAQLNREAYSPLDMAVQNIAEASDIEHSANIVLLLWNSRTKPIPQKNSYYLGKDEKLSNAALKLEAKGFTIGQEGKLYGTLAKNRGGARGIEAIFDFNGNTGRIEPNLKEKKEEQPEPQQGKLNFSVEDIDQTGGSGEGDPF